MCWLQIVFFSIPMRFYCLDVESPPGAWLMAQANSGAKTSLWRFFLLLDFFGGNFVYNKLYTRVVFQKKTPLQYEIFSRVEVLLVLLGTGIHLAAGAPRICGIKPPRVEGSNRRDQTGNIPMPTPNQPSSWGACPDQLLVCHVLSKEHLKMRWISFPIFSVLGIHPICKFYIMEIIIAESQVIRICWFHIT